MLNFVINTELISRMPEYITKFGHTRPNRNFDKMHLKWCWDISTDPEFWDGCGAMMIIKPPSFSITTSYASLVRNKIAKIIKQSCSITNRIHVPIRDSPFTLRWDSRRGSKKGGWKEKRVALKKALVLGIRSDSSRTIQIDSDVTLGLPRSDQRIFCINDHFLNMSSAAPPDPSTPSSSGTPRLSIQCHLLVNVMERLTSCISFQEEAQQEEEQSQVQWRCGEGSEWWERCAGEWRQRWRGGRLGAKRCGTRDTCSIARRPMRNASSNRWHRTHRRNLTSQRAQKRK